MRGATSGARNVCRQNVLHYSVSWRRRRKFASVSAVSSNVSGNWHNVTKKTAKRLTKVRLEEVVLMVLQAIKTMKIENLKSKPVRRMHLLLVIRRRRSRVLEVAL